MSPEKSLKDRLRALGVRPAGGKSAPGPAVRQTLPLDGEWRAEGAVFVRETTYPRTVRRGALPPTRRPVPQVVADWAGRPALSGLSASDFLFLDTETSGLAGGTGTYAFLVGAARWQGEQLRLAQFFMPAPDKEPALLQALAGFAAGAQAVVSFNGKTFDLPLLHTRYRLHRLAFPFADWPHLDVLFLARRIWRQRLASRSLQALEAEVLGLERTSQETPGQEIPYLYFDYLRTGQAAPLAGVFYHNAEDVVSLAQLTAHLCGWLADPLAYRGVPALDLEAAARLYEQRKRYEEAARLYERALAAPDLPPETFWLAVRRLAVLQRRRGDLEAAVGWWRQAAAQGQVYAMVELAKFYEHRQKDLPAALDWARRAQQALQAGDWAAHQRAYWQEDLNKRLARLERRLRRQQGL